MEMQAAWAQESPKPVTLTTNVPMLELSSDEIWLQFSKLPQLPKNEPRPAPAQDLSASGGDGAQSRPVDCTAALLNVSGESDPAAEDYNTAKSEQKPTAQQTSMKQLVEERNRASGEESLQKQNVPASIAENVSEVTINGHRAFHVAEGYYALPTCPVPDDQLDSWQAVFSPRLESELLQAFRKEICQLEFLMFAGKHGRVEPGILLTCLWEKSSLTTRDRERLRKKIQKRVNKFESLRSCLFPCRVIVDSIRLLAFAESERLTNQERHRMDVDCKIPNQPMTMCGALLRVVPYGRNEPVHCTLGGILAVGATVYGLTVRHPFILPFSEAGEPRSSSCSEYSFSELLIDSEDIDADDDTISSSRSKWLPSALPTPPGNEGRDLAITSEATLASTAFRDEQYHDARYYAPFGAFYKTAFDGHFKAVDAMLVALTNTSHILPNQYRLPNSNQWENITDVARRGSKSLQPNRSVFVIAGMSGVMPGRLGQSGINLEIGRELYCVQQIILEKPLVPGDSGSWVVQGTTLVGYIIAGRAMFPWAYMIPVTELVDLVDQLSQPWTLEISQPRMPESTQQDSDPEQFYKAIPNSKPPTPNQLLAQLKEFPREKTISDTGLLVTSNTETAVVTPSMYNLPIPSPQLEKKQTGSISIDDLLNALLLEPVPLHSKQFQIRRDHPHEIALLRSEAADAGISLRRRDEKVSRQWLQSLGDELESIF